MGIVQKRILALVLAAAGVFPPLAHALGLGAIEVYSALNQPLVAEIDLSSVRPGETDGMIVKLAPQEAFDRAGIERHYHLTRLKFDLDTRPDGTPYIKVSTENPVREPFLSFLIDVDWPRGRLVREYTVLLDPPVFATGDETQAEAPVAGTAAGERETGFESTAGEPALIERRTEPGGAGKQPAGRDSDFAADFGVESTASAAELTADLPELEVQEDQPVETAAAGEEPFEFPPAEDWEGEPAGEDFAFEDEPFDQAEPAGEESAFPVFEDEEPLFGEEAAGEEAFADEPEWADAGEQAPLPDIDVAYDASIPYDEAATNALMAQFAAEDEARTRGAGTVADTGDVSDEDPGEHQVRSGETLHEIASRYKAPDVTVNQAMLALLRYNPDAFIRDNINNVKKGFVLRVPDRESMLEIDSAEALAEVRHQHALWREYRSQLAGAPSTERDAQEADRLALSERSAGTDSGGELSIVSPGREAEASERASGAQEGTESGSSLYLDLQLAREQLEAERLEKQELQARITELNEQIEKQDRLISVQSEQLARLQQQLNELESGSTTPGPATPESEPAATATEPAEDTGSETGAEPRSGLGMTLQAGDEAPGGPETEEDPFGEPLPVDDALSGDTLAGQTDTGMQDASNAADESMPGTGEAAPDERAPAGETAGTETGRAGATGESPTDADPSAKPVRPVKARGLIAGYAYDLLPVPWNVMAAEALDTPVGLGVAGAVALALVLMLVMLLKPAGKGKYKSRSKPSALIQAMTPQEADGETAEQTTRITAKKQPLGERLSAMFAPLAGAFSAKKKSQPAPESVEVDHEPPTEEDGDEAFDEPEEIESFEETARTAAAQTEQAPAAREREPAAPAPAASTESEEEFSDDTTQEADVYLAYGLHDQAEELLKQAISSNPLKLEYKGKLLEAYFAGGKKAEFEKLADEVHTQLEGRTSRIWDKTVAMGKEIAPENRLFREADTGGLSVADFAPAKPETADLDLSEPQGATTPDIAFDEDEAAPASTTTDFDLDLGEGEEGGDLELDTLIAGPGDEAESEPELEQAGESGESELEFDLNADGDEVGSELEIDFNAEELGLDEETADAGTDDGESDEGGGEDMDKTMIMDMSFSLDDEGGESDDGEQPEESDAIELDTGEEAFDLSGVDDVDDVDVTTFEPEDEYSASDDLIADLDLGSGEDEQGGAESEASSDTEFDISDDDDTIIDADLDDETISGDSNLDEVATKLDLAKAYMDMGDTDGASSTLEEVLAEGNDDQRREAEELLDQIN